MTVYSYLNNYVCFLIHYNIFRLLFFVKKIYFVNKNNLCFYYDILYFVYLISILFDLILFLIDLFYQHILYYVYLLFFQMILFLFLNLFCFSLFVLFLHKIYLFHLNYNNNLSIFLMIYFH